MKHTPGPWEIGGMIHCECPASSNNCWHMFDYQREIFPPLGESGPIACIAGEDADNAHLIAAAPEMFGALAKVLYGTYLDAYPEFKAEIEAVYAKAEGSAQ